MTRKPGTAKSGRGEESDRYSVATAEHGGGPGNAGAVSGKSGDAVIYEDIPGFCKSATLDEVHKHGHVLTPGRYVGAEVQEDYGEPFAEKMQRLVATLREQQAEAAKLDATIATNLKGLGYDL